ncbi:MAG: tRNA (adenosine(37)-N6)-threonylcarbamoyltransferase complex ATPase subunit type 1 TsaE [Candidatus Magasanikbacteria bacterium]|nr:tRNA (adenosine(37)-N6)-threonylcarbamoyltransferase complex ATPase subunit type 1 TsaE [Candidatus Magasanikbacteria bacterium]
MEFNTQTEIETKQIGKDLATKLNGSEIITLEGDLGAGKTTFVKGLAEGLGIKKEITSPTFTLMNVYELTASSPKLKALVHIDTYRLKNEQELLNIGVEDYLGSRETITVIEWPEKVSGLLKDKKIIEIKIKHITETKRKLEVNNK